MKIQIESLEAMQGFANSFVKNFKKEKRTTSGACIIGLKGDLGSGKTTFTKSVALALGIKDTVTSPTFVIEKIYNLPKKTAGFRRLIHIDAYRLDEGKELDVLGFQEIIKDKQNLILIEWPEQVADILPSNMKTVQFTFVSDKIREIEE